MSISRRQLVCSATALALLPRLSRAAPSSTYYRATLGSSQVIARGLEQTTELASTLLQFDELVRTLCGVAGPVAGSPLNVVVLTGAEVRRVREATGKLDTGVNGNRDLSIGQGDSRRRFLTTNGDLLRRPEERLGVQMYWLTETELMIAGRTAQWYRVGYCNLFDFARFKSSTEITIGGSSPPARYVAEGRGWLPLRELLALPLRAAIDKGVGAAYAGQTFYIAHYLSFARPELRPAFAALAKQDELASPEAVDAACATTLPLPLAEFETALQSYSRGKHMTYTYSLQPFKASADNPAPLSAEALDAEVTAAIDRLRPSKA
jgi:hypothetical protein